ncbi:MATE family efflux transporter [Ignavibacteria bacterium]|nr:MATE family efflux transporter [Bacteroidota bacterium]MCZ2132572.1 MATE family efflux transporter [Bacteroidota bacterium]
MNTKHRNETKVSHSISQKPPYFSRSDLLSGPAQKSLLYFTLPLAFSFLVNMLYSLIDTYFVSHIGKEAIAAIGISEQLGFFVFNFGGGFAIGTGIILARRIGEGNRQAADYVATQSLLAMALLSTMLATALYYLLPYILPHLAKDPAVEKLAYIYMSALVFGIPGNFITFLVNAIVRSSGNSVLPMTILFTTTIINAILAPILIFGLGPVPELGIQGAGIATAVAQIMGAVISLWVMFSGKSDVRIIRDKLKIDFSLLWRIVKQAVPASLQMFSVSATRISLFGLAASFGTPVIAAYTLGLKVDLFVFMSVFATGVALEIATGQNLGAKQPERIWIFHRAALRQLIVVIAFLGVCAFSFSEKFAELFTQDAAVISETVSYLHIVTFGYLFFAVALTTTRVISGAGAAFRSMAIVAGSLLFLQLPACFILAKFTPLNQQGIWVGIVTGYALFMVIALVNLYRKKWLAVNI